MGDCRLDWWRPHVVKREVGVFLAYVLEEDRRVLSYGIKKRC